MMGFIETIGMLTMANSVHWHGHALIREDGNVLRMTLEFEGEAQTEKQRPEKYIEAAGWRNNHDGWIINYELLFMDKYGVLFHLR